MVERSESAAWLQSPEHADLIERLQQDYDDAFVKAEAQAKEDIERELKRRQAARSAPKTQIEANPEYLGDDLVGHVGSKAVQGFFKGFRR